MNFQKKLSTLNDFRVVKKNKNAGKKYNANQILKYTIRTYYKNKNWDGLLKYLLLMEERNFLPQTWRWQIAQMYIYINNPKQSLDYLQNLYRENSDNPNVQLTILEALKAMGKSELSFNWEKKPKIHTVNREALLECYNIIRQNKNAIPLFILYSIAKSKQVCDFDEFDLLFALKKDSRFSVMNDTCFFRFSRIDIKAEILKITA